MSPCVGELHPPPVPLTPAELDALVELEEPPAPPLPALLLDAPPLPPLLEVAPPWPLELPPPPHAPPLNNAPIPTARAILRIIASEATMHRGVVKTSGHR